MSWAETNDRFQVILDSIEYMHGVITPFVYESEGWEKDIADHYREMTEETKRNVIDAWREAHQQAGYPLPTPSYVPTMGSFLEGIMGPVKKVQA